MRFAEPFKQSENISANEKAENERLMFLELTQGDDTAAIKFAPLTHYASMPLGQLNRSFALDQHDGGSD